MEVLHVALMEWFETESFDALVAPVVPAPPHKLHTDAILGEDVAIEAHCNKAFAAVLVSCPKCPCLA